MNKNLSKIYTLVVLIALIFLGAWSAWTVYQLRSDNRAAAQVNVDKIKETVEKSYNSETAFNNNEFFNVIRSIFNDNPELEIVTIYSHDEDRGIEYHYNRGVETQLLNLEESSPLSKKDLPEYKYNQLMKTRLTSNLQIGGTTGLDMDLIYQVVDRRQVYDILIRILIVVVVLFFTTLLMIFAVSRKKPLPLQVADENEGFDSDIDSDDDLSLDWDEKGFDMKSADQPESSEPDFGDFTLDDTGDDFGDFNLDDASDDFSDINLDEPSDHVDDFNLDDVSGDFDDIKLDEPSDHIDDFGDLNLDDASADFEDMSDDFSETSSDELEMNKSGGDFEDISFDDTDSDFGDLNLDGDSDVESDSGFDDIETDFPEEEDLLAMDHETAPSDNMKDFDFDDIDDTFSDDSAKDTSDDAKSLYSPKSGVGWEDFIEERVNLELERAASFDQDLVMGVIQCESLTEDNYKIFADQLKEEFNYPDMIFEYKENGFAIIVPNNDLDEALRTLETFTGKEQEQYGNINVGISSRNGRLITGNRIFMEAENALHKAVEDMDKNIVGFRSDPDKFRDFLSNKS